MNLIFCGAWKIRYYRCYMRLSEKKKNCILLHTLISTNFNINVHLGLYVLCSRALRKYMRMRQQNRCAFLHLPNALSVSTVDYSTRFVGEKWMRCIKIRHKCSAGEMTPSMKFDSSIISDHENVRNVSQKSYGYATRVGVGHLHTVWSSPSNGIATNSERIVKVFRPFLFAEYAGMVLEWCINNNGGDVTVSGRRKNSNLNDRCDG